ncbi:MAG: HepT-like ribonuclease domain-containing protein [Thermodesulfobacteriota bacterium]
MILQLERVGEAAARLSESVRRECPQIPWQDIVGMRNLLIHEYFGICPTRVWITVVNDIPILKECVNRILATMNEP